MSWETRTRDREALARLPRWACVAFAARCARRVQPLYKLAWADAPDRERHVAAIDRAITLAESCAGAAADAGAGAAADAVDARAADAANAAARAAGYAAGYAAAADADADADAAAAYAAAYAAAGDAAANAAMQRDVALLAAAAKDEGWTDRTPVPPAFFGPLWPEGVPEGWPAAEEGSENCELVFELEVPEDTDDETIYTRAVELADRADALHRAYGGRGLKVKAVEVFDQSRVREGVPS